MEKKKTGKTALARSLCTSLIEASQPVLFVDFSEIGNNPNLHRLRSVFEEEFHGDFTLWLQQPFKTLIVDNMKGTPGQMSFIAQLKGYFDRLYLFTSLEIFTSFLQAEARFSEFNVLQIHPLTHAKQEELIRARLSVNSTETGLDDGFVNQVENRVNSIIITSRIVPRYPFYILSIMQTFEGYMPGDISITSYGHCYYVLILDSLINSGVSNKDNELNTCFNFAQHLAFHIHNTSVLSDPQRFDFEAFASIYEEKFHIDRSTISKMQMEGIGILGHEGLFRSKYTYYYFLTQYLSTNDNEKCSHVIQDMCENSYQAQNYMTLLFIIHHTNDTDMIDDILLRTMLSLGEVDIATLNSAETHAYRTLLSAIPDNVLSRQSVEVVRQEERNLRDYIEEMENEDDEVDFNDIEPVNDIFRILKNNKILGQVLRTKYGALERKRVQEIIEVISDSGLRLINLLLQDESSITEYAEFLHERWPEMNVNELENLLRKIHFFWIVINLNEICHAINVPEIKSSINAVVNRRSTPAYDLIGYFCELDRSLVFGEQQRTLLRRLLRRHGAFVGRLLSIRTQQHMNSNRILPQMRQSLRAILGI